MVLAMAILAALVELAPIVAPIIQDALDHGVDPASLDWQKIIGRNIQALQAEVDAERTREA